MARSPDPTPARYARPAGALGRDAERARILETAYRLLTASGGASVSVVDVLAAAGMSTRAFYRHFDSKDALLLAMFRSDSERVLADLSATADRAATARDALHGWILAMLRLAADPRRRQRALVLASDEVTRAKGFRAESDRYQVRQDTALTELLRRGLADGSLPGAMPEADAPLVRAAFLEGFQIVMARPVGVEVSPVAESVLSFVDRALGIRTGQAHDGH